LHLRATWRGLTVIRCYAQWIFRGIIARFARPASEWRPRLRVDRRLARLALQPVAAIPCV